jgi:DNA-nicking Smr family endonuclease
MRSKHGLADLKQLHQQTLAAREQAGREAAAREAQARREQAAPENDLAAFRRALGGSQPLKQQDRTVEHRAPAAAAPAEALASRRAHALGERPAPAGAGVSDAGVAHLLSENGTAYVRTDAAPDTARKLRRGHWRAGAEIDLHGLRVEQARHALLSFLDECLEHGIRCARVVHGKGYGSSQGLGPVLKDKARAWLVQKPEVIAFSEAPEREGGSGALRVLLTGESKR